MYLVALIIYNTITEILQNKNKQNENNDNISNNIYFVCQKIRHLQPSFGQVVLF